MEASITTICTLCMCPHEGMRSACECALLDVHVSAHTCEDACLWKCMQACVQTWGPALLSMTFLSHNMWVSLALLMVIGLDQAQVSDVGGKVKGEQLRKSKKKMSYNLGLRKEDMDERKSNFLMWNKLSCKRECFEFS